MPPRSPARMRINEEWALRSLVSFRAWSKDTPHFIRVMFIALFKIHRGSVECCRLSSLGFRDPEGFGSCQLPSLFHIYTNRPSRYMPNVAVFRHDQIVEGMVPGLRIWPGAVKLDFRRDAAWLYAALKKKLPRGETPTVAWELIWMKFRLFQSLISGGSVVSASAKHRCLHID